jgi:hypothetical protein
VVKIVLLLPLSGGILWRTISSVGRVADENFAYFFWFVLRTLDVKCRHLMDANIS